MNPRFLLPLLLLFLAGLVSLAGPFSLPAMAEDIAPEATTEKETNEESEVPWWKQQEAKIDEVFGTYLVTPLSNVLFFDFYSTRWFRQEIPEEVTCGATKGCPGKIIPAETWPDGDAPVVMICPECGEEIETGISVPLVVLWLLAGAIFFTIRMGFINLRGFWHGIRLTMGAFDKPGETGEVTHFQALASALSATVGLGNIAGVAIAVGLGGPGAIFWMILAGLLGMSSKFAECTLGQMYRKVAPDGTVSGGPMHYLRDGLADMRLGPISLAPLGTVLSVMFLIMCMGGSFGGGCTFQVVQSLGVIKTQVPFFQDHGWVYGVIMVVMAGVVIIGGIRRIAATAEKIVPAMCGVYVIASLYILGKHYTLIDDAFIRIFQEAFSPGAAYGGFLGVMVIGIKRAAFSNEAGIGSAAIAHAAAKTDEPVSEGIVALLEPFIDTVVICTMTGLVIVITGVFEDPQYAHLIAQDDGAVLTSHAFAGTISWFPYVLCVAVFLFAYSTMISWSYYGERCWSRLVGERYSIIYKFLFLGFVMLGSLVTATNIKDFSDLMILSMAFPNILGVALLSGKVRGSLNEYWGRYRAGELDPE